MNLNDRQALLAAALLGSILASIGVDVMDWDSISKLSWSVTAMVAMGAVLAMLQSLFLGLYWMIWTLMPRKKMKRRGVVLAPGDAETVRLHVQDLIREYREVPRFNFDNYERAS